MRIAIAGIATESSTFTRDLSPRERFSVERGEAIYAMYDWPRRFADLPADVEFVPLTIASVSAGGPVTAGAYDELEAEILDGLRRQGPFDGVYLHMHGAMSVVGRDAAEERFVAKVRALAGPGAVLSMSMDPHGNLSRELAGLVDLAAAHRQAPHVDRWDTRERSVRHLVEVIRRGARPHRAWVRVPILLPGERTSTEAEPGRSAFGAMLPAIERHGVLDANMWTGFYWADEPRNCAAVLVTGWDAQAALACAGQLAEGLWAVRHRFAIAAGHHGCWDEALDFALSGAAAPVYLSDSGDNVSAGGSGDMTFALSRTLARADVMASGKTFVFAGLVDPATFGAALTAGPGAVLERSIGATADSRFAGPVPGRWMVERVIDGVFGEGPAAVLLRDGPVTVSVQWARRYFVSTSDPAWAGYPMPGLAWFDTSGYDIVVVKNGYLFTGQAAAAGSHFMAITPGGTDLDAGRLAWARVARPLFPLDQDFEADLTPVLLPR